MSLSKTPSRKHDEYKIKYTAMSQYISEPFKKNIHRFFSFVIFSVPCTLSPRPLQNHSNNAQIQNGTQQPIKQINDRTVAVASRMLENTVKLVRTINSAGWATCIFYNHSNAHRKTM